MKNRKLNTLSRVTKDDIINVIMSYEESKGTNMNKFNEDEIKIHMITKTLKRLQMFELLINN